MKNRKFRAGSMAAVFVAAFLLPFILAGESHAVLITESMIFVGERQSSAVFKLKNTSKQPQAFRIDWTNLRMTPSGSKEAVAEGETVPGLLPAEDYVYVAPRRLVLQPGQLQHIRFMVRRNRDMPAGEYRSYFTIQPEEIPQAYSQSAQDDSVKQGAAATVRVLAGYRIPLFFLHGDTTLDVEFANVRKGPDRSGNEALFFTVRRSGSRSALGQAEVTCTMPDGEKIGLVTQRIQIFTELDSRDYHVYPDTPPEGCTNTTLSFVPHKGDPLYRPNEALASTPL